MLGTGWEAEVTDSALEEISMESVKQDESVNATGVRKVGVLCFGFCFFLTKGQYCISE